MRISITLLFIMFLPPSILGQSGVDSDYAPNFSYTTPDGLIEELDDYKGKVVYISFWASWCGPCIQGFKKYAEIRKEVEELGVVMLNISIDADHHDWRDMMSNLKVPGVHGIVNKINLIDDYELYSIPHYEIVGHDGKRLYLNRDEGKSITDNFVEFLARK